MDDNSSHNDTGPTQPDSSIDIPGISRRSFLAGTSAISLLSGLSVNALGTTTSRAASNLTPGELPLKEYLETPEIIGENQEPGHVPTIPFSSAMSALNLERNHDSPRDRWEKSPYYKTLNGEWNFNWSVNPDAAPDDFDAADEWATIDVPRNWQSEGYGHPMYRNIMMDLWPYDPPHVPDSINPVGSYHRTFTVPQSWTKQRRTFLRFDGVKSAYFVWVNGEYVGYDEGSMTAGEFDVTDQLDHGKNTISVQVFRWSGGSYLENQDMWRFSGIYRDVYLYSTPDVHLRDYDIRTDLDDDYRDATLTIDAEVVNSGDSSGRYTVRGHLFDSTYQKVGTMAGRTNVPADGQTQITLSKRVSNPDKWSAEHPNVYRLLLELVPVGQRKSIETQLAKIGFREYEIIDGQIHVNGEPVAFRGVNHHEHDPQYCRHLPTEMRRKDFERAKQFNINAMRNSHYPRGPEFYEFADEYGIYVVDEVNDETHQNIHLVDDYPAFHASFLDRFRRMVQQWKNHASIFMWSTGNECGLGPAHFDMADYAQRVDPTRFLYHQANNGGVAPYADVIGPRYPSPDGLVSIAKDEDEQRPSVMGEYNHAMGNSLGLVKQFWEEMPKYDQLQGGFIWDWVNQGLDRALVTTPDASETGSVGVLHGNPDIVTGNGSVSKEQIDDGDQVKASALALSGLDDWVELYRDPSLDITEPGLTLEVEVKPQDPWTGSDPYITKGDYQYGLKMGDEETLQFFVYDPDDGWVTAAGTVPDGWTGNWHHIAGVHTGSELRLYVDGTELASEPHEGTINHNPAPVNVGRNVDKHRENYTGWLSNATFRRATIYDRALSSNELRTQRAPSDDGTVLWLEFQTFEREGSFRSYGVSPFCCNGLVDAERNPQPELWELKKAHQPVAFDAVDLQNGKVAITNEHNFTNLLDFDISWELRADADVLQTGTIPLDIPPGSNHIATIPFNDPAVEPGTTYWLTIRVLTTTDEWWADAGHEIAFEQFEIPFDVPEPEMTSIDDMPHVSIGENY